jgi:hypothetical protein
VNRLVSIIVGATVLVAAAGLLLLTRSRSPVPAPAATTEARPPSPDLSPAPAAPPLPRVFSPDAPQPAETTKRADAKPRPNAPAAAPVRPAPDLVTLSVDSDVSGAQVFVDRTFIGKTPLTTTEVKAGSHRLNVSAPGYEGRAQDLELAPGARNIIVTLREVRLDTAINVIHKHRIGSCSGRLVASPHGMRYETSEKEDGFRTGLLDLGTFDVNYLEKTLRVQLPSGKRYDFTDPDGNADRLFVFHRDVEKARERLKKGDPPARE